MGDELPPPPSYHSLFDGGQDPPPSAPPQPAPSTHGAEGAHRHPKIGAGDKSSSRSLSRQTSLDSPYPPSHPFYPGAQNLPPHGPDGLEYSPGREPQPTGYAGNTYPSASAPYPPPGGAGPGYPPPSGAIPAYPPGASPYPSGQAYPPPVNEKQPLPPGDASNYPPPGAGGYGQPSGQPYPTANDPLLHPPYGGQPAPGAAYNTTGPFGSFGPSPAGHPSHTAPGIDGSLIPIVIYHEPRDENGYPINPVAPGECRLDKPEDHPNMILAEGQRTHIDQLEENADPALFKWCCVAFWSLGAHVGFFICVILLIWQVPLKAQYDAWWYEASRLERISDGDKFAYNSTTLICASVFLVVCWLVAVLEACMSDTDTYVSNVQQLSDFRQDHSKVRTKVPVVVWEGEAYHHAKERVEWKNGVVVSRRRSSDTHRVVSYMKTVAFPFRVCVDASGDLDTFKKGVINRFEFEKTFGFLDEHTQQLYKAQKEAFINHFQGRDEKQEFTETLVLPDMKERATVFMEEGCRTSLMSSGFYSCLTCFLLTWPYRIFFRVATRKKNYTFVKLIGL